MTTTTSAIDLNNGITSIVLDGVGSNLLTSASDITLAAVTDTANIAELELNGESINLAAITLNNSGANLLDVNLDGATDNGVRTLALTGNLLVGTMTLDGQNSDDTVTIPLDIDITASNGNLDLDNTIGAISLTGTAGENEIKTTGGTGDISIGAVGNTSTASDLIVTTATATTSGDITMNGAVTGVGYVKINAGSTTSGNTGDVAINANITANDANGGLGVDLDASNNIVVNAAITTTDGGTAQAIDLDSANTGTVTFGAAGALDADTTASVTGANGVTMTSGSSITADTTAEVIATAGNIALGQVTAGTRATLTASTGSITDNNTDATNNVTATTLVASAQDLVGNANDNILLNPGGTGFDALETAVANLTVTTTAANADIAIDNTKGSTLTVDAVTPSTGQDATMWIRNDSGVTVSTWTIDGNDNVALLAAAGNVTFPDGGAGVIDTNGNLVNPDISVGTGKVRLEAAAGIVQDSASRALVIAASDLVIKSNTLNNETTGSAVGNFAATPVELAVLLSGKLDVDINSDAQNLRILGANSGGNSADLKIGDVDSDTYSMTTNGTASSGELTVTVLNGTSATTDDSDESSPTLAIYNTLNTDNANINLNVLGLNVTGGNSQDAGNIQILSGATVQTDATNDQLGTTTLTGDVKIIGQVFANSGETISITGPSDNITIDPTGVAGSGILTLSPGTGKNVDFQPGANVSVVSGGGNPGSLVIKNAANVVMDPTATVVVDGSVDIGHGGAGGVADSVTGNITLSNITLDSNGDGDGTNPVGLFVKATGNVILAGAIDANADPDGTKTANDVTIVAGGTITNNSGSVVAIDEVDNLTLTTGSGIGILGTPLTVNADTISATSSGNGNIYLSNTPNVMALKAADDIVTISSLSTPNGAISYKQQGKDLSIGGTGISSGNGNILIDPPVNLTVDANINAGTGNITVQATNNVTINEGDLITNGGTVLVQADSDASGGGNLVFNDSTGLAADSEKIRSGVGTVQLRGEHISVKDYSVKTTGLIDILAGQGGTSTGEIYSAAAANGSFDLSGATFDIEANGAGIGQSGGNTIEIVASGQIDAKADGPIHLTSVASNALSVGLIDAGANAVTVVGNANVTDAGTDSATDIIATTLTINDGAGTPGTAGTITLDTAVATLNLNGGAVTIHDGDGVDISSITATSLDLLTTGAITDSGAVSVNNLAKFNSTGNAITLGDGTTASFGSLDFAGSTVSITESNAMVIEESQATGALSLVAGGSITQTGAIDSISTSSFNAGAHVITLTQANDFAGAVSLSNTGDNLVQVKDANAIDLGTVNVGGDLTVTSTGTITDSGAVTVIGKATLVSGGNAITLGDTTTLAMGSVDFAGSTVSIKEASDMVLEASEATGGDLTLDAGTNSITQNGLVNAPGAVSLTGGVITLTQDNILGSITVASGAGQVKITEADTTNGIDIAAITRTDGDLTLDGKTNAIGQIGTGVISIDDGALKLTGGAITLNNNNVVGAITVATGSGNVSITEADTLANGMDIASITRTGGNVTLNSGITPIDQTGVISIASGALNLTGGTITLTNDNTLGAITVASGSGNVSLTEDDSTNGMDVVSILAHFRKPKPR